MKFENDLSERREQSDCCEKEIDMVTDEDILNVKDIEDAVMENRTNQKETTPVKINEGFVDTKGDLNRETPVCFKSCGSKNTESESLSLDSFHTDEMIEEKEMT